MTVKVNDIYELMDRTACWGSLDFFSETYQVLAIRVRRKRRQYLVEFGPSWLNWCDQDLFTVIDENKPSNWVTVQYKRFHKYKNKKYDFHISTSYYQGPKAFLDNEDFFFDIIENRAVAYEYYYQTVKKLDDQSESEELIDD